MNPRPAYLIALGLALLIAAGYWVDLHAGCGDCLTTHNRSIKEKS